MAVTRILLLKTGIVPDIGTVALMVTAAGVISPLLLHWLVTTRFDSLFRRPAFFYIDRPRRPALQPAE